MAQTYLTLPGNIKMPTIGLGTWESTDEAELETALNTALELGYRHIDTAYFYGNEHVIGRVLNQWFSSGKLKREDIFLTTKLPHPAVHPDRVEFFIKKSLNNLQLDYIDLYLIHLPIGYQYDVEKDRPILDSNGNLIPEGPTDHEAIWKKMEEQVDAGRTKLIGLSNYNIKQIERVLKCARIKPANLQIEVHVFLQQEPLVEYCHKKGLSVVAYSPLASPAINKFYQKLNHPGKQLPDILNNDLIKKLAEKYSKTPAQIALRFLIQRNIVPIPKSVTPKRIIENFDVYNFQISDDDMAALRKLDQGAKGRVCDFSTLKDVAKHPDYPF